ncbi:unnamed protein product [Plutella xylostella]|uniref:(diamondback moth) hypothetical protein n=1 Tax=Plutella xylostella TaxID=51655 RepID=A0A8S4GAZ4_PLUXY|nr:unnamed protein product [Plutella xylostella]
MAAITKVTAVILIVCFIAMLDKATAGQEQPTHKEAGPQLSMEDHHLQKRSPFVNDVERSFYERPRIRMRYLH